MWDDPDMSQTKSAINPKRLFRLLRVEYVGARDD